MDITMQRISELLKYSKDGNKGLAQHLGVSPNLITNWKNGRNQSYPKYLKSIAEYFGVSEGYLKGGGNEKSPQPKAEGYTDRDFDLFKKFKALPLEQQEAIRTLIEAGTQNNQGPDE